MYMYSYIHIHELYTRFPPRYARPASRNSGRVERVDIIVCTLFSRLRRRRRPRTGGNARPFSLDCRKHLLQPRFV